MRAHEAPDEPLVWTAEGPEPLGQVRHDVLAGPRLARVGDRELRDLRGIDAGSDLQPIPRASLEILRRDRIRVEVARAHQMQRAAHEARADHGVLLLDRVPQALALEVLEA